MRALFLTLFTVVLALFAPHVLAHGAAEANELEVELFADEGNEFNDARGGWDVTQVFLGEAHEHALGHGVGGDGLYWRAELYGVPGGPSPLASGEWRAVFTMETAKGPLVREIRTLDGKTFLTDFDLLVTNVTDGIVHVERGFIALQENGLAPGSVVDGFRIETYVGEELRDRAPGGIPIAGPLEAPSQSTILTESYTLTGPVLYAAASLEATPDGPVLLVKSLLKKGAQHVHAHFPAEVETSAPTMAALKAGETASFPLQFSKNAPEHIEFDVTTDIGGRVSIALHREGGQTTLLTDTNAPAASVDHAKMDGGTRDVPAPALALVVAALAFAALRRRVA